MTVLECSIDTWTRTLLSLILLSSGLFVRLLIKGSIVTCGPQLDSTILHCSKQQLTSIPTSLIHRDTIELDLAYNFITTLHEDSFTHFKRLRKLSLKSNRISKLTERAFVPLASSLAYLDLSSNQLMVDEFGAFPIKAFAVLTKLIHLDLSNNSIHFLPSGFLVNLGPTMERLLLRFLSSNLHIQPCAFHGLANLHHLSLAGNTFAPLDPEAFRGLEPTSFTRIELRGVNWTCDCRIAWLRDWFEKVPRHALNADPYPGGQCSHPVINSGQALMTVNRSLFQCAPKLIKYAPRSAYNSDPMPIATKPNQNITLSCTFLSNPKGQTEWYLNGVLIKRHWDRFKVTTSSGSTFDTKLYIANFKQSNETGLYKCITSNLEGSASKTFKLASNHSTDPTTVDSDLSDTDSRSIKTVDSRQGSNFSFYILIVGAVMLCNTGLIIVATVTYNCVKYREARRKNGQTRKIDTGQLTGRNFDDCLIYDLDRDDQERSSSSASSSQSPTDILVHQPNIHQHHSYFVTNHNRHDSNNYAGVMHKPVNIAYFNPDNYNSSLVTPEKFDKFSSPDKHTGSSTTNQPYYQLKMERKAGQKSQLVYQLADKDSHSTPNDTFDSGEPATSSDFNSPHSEDDNDPLCPVHGPLLASPCNGRPHEPCQIHADNFDHECPIHGSIVDGVDCELELDPALLDYSRLKQLDNHLTDANMHASYCDIRRLGRSQSSAQSIKRPLKINTLPR